MSWVTYALFGLAAVSVTIAVVVITQNRKEEEMKTEEIEEQGRLGGYQTIHDLDDPTTLRKLTNEGLRLTLNGATHFAVEENLTTGYGWELEKDGGDCGRRGVISVSLSYDAPHFGEDELEPVGAPGTKYFSFFGSSNGSCTWRAAYARSWEFDWGDRIGNAARLLEIDFNVAN